MAELKGLPALKQISLRNNQLIEPPTLGKKIEVAVDGNPFPKTPLPEPTAAGSAVMAPAAPSGFVAKLPKFKGKLTGNGPHRTRGGLFTTPPLEASGIYDSLVGTVGIGFADQEGGDPTVEAELSVETGRVRVYLGSLDLKGYVYSEATPGHPARVKGWMLSGASTLDVAYESLDGTATGIRYRVRSMRK